MRLACGCQSVSGANAGPSLRDMRVCSLVRTITYRFEAVTSTGIKYTIHSLPARPSALQLSGIDKFLLKAPSTKLQAMRVLEGKQPALDRSFYFIYTLCYKSNNKTQPLPENSKHSLGQVICSHIHCTKLKQGESTGLKVKKR